MSDARQRIVSAVRDGLRRGVLPGPEDPGASPTTRVSPPASTDALVAAFTQALEALKGTVQRVATPEAARDAVVALAAGAHASAYLSWDEDAIGCPGLFDALTAHGQRREVYDLPATAAARDRALLALSPVTLGITGADAALADSGGLVLVHGPGRGRLCSLLPPVHVAVVPTARLVPDLETVLAARPALLDEASNVVVIAGPSRTADIEMTLTHGVHGPRHVHVVLVG